MVQEAAHRADRMVSCAHDGMEFVKVLEASVEKLLGKVISTKTIFCLAQTLNVPQPPQNSAAEAKG